MILIVVKGRPASFNSSSRNKRRWRDLVAAEATSVCSTPSSCDFEVNVTFFYKAVPDFDTDNMSKPTIDALKGIAFLDDRQVKKRSVTAVDLNGSFRIVDPDPRVSAAITDGVDFVSITIREADMKAVNL